MRAAAAAACARALARPSHARTASAKLARPAAEARRRRPAPAAPDAARSAACSVRNASALSGATSSAALSASAAAHAAPSAGSIVRVQPRSRAVPPSSAYRASVAGGKVVDGFFSASSFSSASAIFSTLASERGTGRRSGARFSEAFELLSEPFSDVAADDDGRECDDDAHSTGECCGGVSCTCVYWPLRPRGWRRAPGSYSVGVGGGAAAPEKPRGIARGFARRVCAKMRGLAGLRSLTTMSSTTSKSQLARLFAISMVGVP